MSTFRRRRPGAALVISVIALIAALGGTAYAGVTLGKNSVGTKQLKKNAVTSNKIKNGAVTTNKLKNGAVTASKINTSGLTVPDAVHAHNADSAANATNATNAINATTAGNANALGGIAPSGYQASVRWALVKADGSDIIAQSGGISITAHIPGGYYLNFGSSIEGRAVSVTESHANNSGGGGGVGVSPCGGNGSGSPPDASVCAVPGTNDANHLFVFTDNPSGSQTNEPFYVVVF